MSRWGRLLLALGLAACVPPKGPAEEQPTSAAQAAREPKPEVPPVSPEPSVVERLQLTCDMGDADSCGELSKVYDGTVAAPGVPRNLRLAAALRAAELAIDGCATGELSGCGMLGYLYLTGQGVTRDVNRAASLLVVACNGGLAHACHNLGVLYAQGLGVSRHPARAVELFDGACQADHPPACTALGAAHHRGLGVERDLTRAIALYRRGCSGGDADGCGALAILQARGEGMAQNVEAAIELLSASCERGSAHSCQHLGERHASGDGVTRDLAKATRLFLQACKGASAVGCQRLAGLLAQGQQLPQGDERIHRGEPAPTTGSRLHLEALLRECAGGSAKACRKLSAEGISDPGF